jgi:hypothetical protein
MPVNTGRDSSVALSETICFNACGYAVIYLRNGGEVRGINAVNTRLKMTTLQLQNAAVSGKVDLDQVVGQGTNKITEQARGDGYVPLLFHFGTNPAGNSHFQISGC